MRKLQARAFSNPMPRAYPERRAITSFEPVERPAPFEESFCLMEPVAMLQAALVIVYFYQHLAPPLAQAHGIPYPADLERVVSDLSASKRVMYTQSERSRP